MNTAGYVIVALVFWGGIYLLVTGAVDYWRKVASNRAKR